MGILLKVILLKRTAVLLLWTSRIEVFVFSFFKMILDSEQLHLEIMALKTMLNVHSILGISLIMDCFDNSCDQAHYEK